MKNTKYKSLVFALVLGIFSGASLLLFPANASAEDSFAMGISRTGEFVENLRAGQTVEQEFNISNQGFDPFDIEISVAPYYAADDGTTENADIDAHTQLSRWITLSFTKATLAPGESVPIKYTISVPSDPPSGGQNAVINITSYPKGGSGVGLGKALGHTVHANIEDGNTRTEASLAVHDVPGFLFAGPINSTIRIDNTGNTDVAAKFTFSVYNFFSEERVYTYEIGRIISFPKSKVTKNLNWDGSPLLGIFRVDSIVEMLGETHVKQQVVIILPVFVIILFVLVVALLVIFLVSRAKTRKQKMTNKNAELKP